MLLKSDLKIVDVLNEGDPIICYLTSDGKVFKEQDNVNILTNIEILKRFKSDLVAFPEEMVYDETETAVGYTMPYIKGNNLSNIDKKMPILNFINAIKEFEREIYNLTGQGIQFVDLNEKNLIYSGNKIVAVDTELYEVCDVINKKIFEESIKDLATTIISMFSLLKNNYNEEIQGLVYSCGGINVKMLVFQMLEKILDILKKDSEEEIVTIEDFEYELNKHVLPKNRLTLT